MNTDHFLDVSETICHLGNLWTLLQEYVLTSYNYFDAASRHRHPFLFQEIKAVGTEVGITPVIIRGEELKQRGFGGTVSVDICLCNYCMLS